MLQHFSTWWDRCCKVPPYCQCLQGISSAPCSAQEPGCRPQSCWEAVVFVLGSLSGDLKLPVVTNGVLSRCRAALQCALIKNYPLQGGLAGSWADKGWDNRHPLLLPLDGSQHSLLSWLVEQGTRWWHHERPWPRCQLHDPCESIGCAQRAAGVPGGSG